MLPGFTGLIANAPLGRAPSQGAWPAGLWDDPKPPECKQCFPIRTDTSCIIVSLWCTDVFNCCGREEKRTPYPCGVCFGADW